MKAIIIDVHADPAYPDWPIIEFSMDNGEDVGFIGTLSYSHACYLSEYHRHHTDHPYDRMLTYFINNWKAADNPDEVAQVNAHLIDQEFSDEEPEQVAAA